MQLRKEKNASEITRQIRVSDRERLLRLASETTS